MTESDADQLLSPTTGDIADSHADFHDAEKVVPDSFPAVSTCESLAESRSTDNGQSGTTGPVFTLLDLGRLGPPVQRRRRPRPAVQIDLFER